MKIKIKTNVIRIKIITNNHYALSDGEAVTSARLPAENDAGQQITAVSVQTEQKQ